MFRVVERVAKGFSPVLSVRLCVISKTVVDISLQTVVVADCLTKIAQFAT